MGGREEFGTQTYVFSAEWWPKHKGIILGFGFWTEGQWGGYREIQSLYHGEFNTPPIVINGS